ncbi:MAG: hypothetical protein K1X55_17935 [Chitinophagales bacterium]|nr:hypothetical protein [Chitinophagales bacterium]
MKNLTLVQKASLLLALAVCIIAPTIGYIKIGWPPVIIVGGAAVIGFFFWYFTYLKTPTDPKLILPTFILTVAGLQIHMVEEYFTGFGPAMSRIFNIPWTEHSFLMVFMMVGPIIYTLTTLGLYFRVPIAGFVAWFIFIGPGMAEFTHFIFPIIEPHIQPENIQNVTASINGIEVANMPNYYYKTTGKFYFSGMWTAVLPMIPGIYAIYSLTKAHRLTQKNK